MIRSPLGSRGDRDRDRAGQAGSSRVLLRRHRGGALPTDPRSRRGLGHLADRRLPLRHPCHRGADGLRDVTAVGHRAREARRPSACSTSKGSGRGTRTRSHTSKRSSRLEPAKATARMQDIYAEDDQARAHRGAAARGPRRRGSPSPRRSARSARSSTGRRSSTPAATCSSSAARRSRPNTSAGRAEPLNLKRFIYELDIPVIVGGAGSYTAALHLMRTGAAGVLVGFGGGAAHTTRLTLGIHAPMASAIADVAAARRDYLDESGGRYVHVIADGGVGTLGRHRQGHRLRSRRRDARCGAGPGQRRAGQRVPLGAGGAPRRAAARRTRRRSGAHGAAARRSSSVPAGWPTGRRTSSAHYAGPWRPPATRTSRSSSGSRSSSRPTCAASGVLAAGELSRAR